MEWLPHFVVCVVVPTDTTAIKNGAREWPRITDAQMGSHLLFSDPPAGEIMNTVTETVLCHLVVRIDEILHLRRGGG